MMLDSARVENLARMTEHEPPLVVFPWRCGTDSSELGPRLRACANRYLRALGVILFRGFATRDETSFRRFVGSVEGGEFRFDLVRSGADRLAAGLAWSPFEHGHASDDDWPLEERPRRPWLCCGERPPVGAALTIVDRRQVLRCLPEHLRRHWCDRGLRAAHTYVEGTRASWSRAFGTRDVARVEQRCSELGLDWQWLGAERLRVEKVYAPVVRHPVTGESFWSSDVGALAEACASSSSDARAAVRHVTFADGGDIPAADLALVAAAFVAAARAVTLEWGDVLLLDDTFTAHGRHANAPLAMWIAKMRSACDAGPGATLSRYD